MTTYHNDCANLSDLKIKFFGFYLAQVTYNQVATAILNQLPGQLVST